MKLSHVSCGGALLDALADFPPHAVLGRAGLIQAMLDVLGSPLACSVEDAEHDPLALHPLLALEWFRKLLVAGEAGFHVQREGSYCSVVPEESPAAAAAAAAAREHGGPGAATLAAELAKTMFSMRHPVLPSGGPADAQRAAAAAAAASATPSPSVPGLAFAVSTAALPLLQRRDPAITCAVLQTLKVALPLVCEPLVEASSTAAAAAAAAGAGAGAAAAGVSDVDVGRLQHLLHRVEQVRLWPAWKCVARGEGL